MKKILVLNGSGKGRESTTLKITNAFIEGYKMVDESANVEIIHLAELSFHHCTGCQICSQITPGKCHYQDDLADIIQKYSQADILIHNWPLHYYSMSSLTQRFIERLNPLLTYVKTHEDEQDVGLKRSIKRTDADNIVMISTCSSADVSKAYEGVSRRLSMHLDNKGLQLFFQNTSYPYASKTINGIDFFKAISWAGQDFARDGKITPEIQTILNKFIQTSEHEILVPKDIAYEQFLDDPSKRQEKRVAYDKLKQMITFYEPSLLKKRNRVLEINFMTLKETYHLILKENEALIEPKGERVPDCKIKTTIPVWQNLMTGNVKLFDVCQSGDLTFEGDQDIMVAIDNGLLYRPYKKEQELSLVLSGGKNSEWVRRKTNHWLFYLLPWIYTLIVIAPVTNLNFLTVPLLVTGLYLLKNSSDTTYFDKGNVILLVILTIIKVFLVDGPFEMNMRFLLILSFIMFGALFSFSLFTKIPITAYLDYRQYFNEVTTLDVYLKRQRLLTFWYATLFILVPIGALLGRLINFTSIDIWLIGFMLCYAVVVELKVKRFKLNYKKKKTC